MNNRPSVSFIIPNYNAGVNLSHAVESIYKKNLLKFEIIVVDDGSGDSSIEFLISMFAREIELQHIRIFKSNHVGAGAARNLGIKHASGRYIMFVDADDELINVNEIEKYISSDDNKDYVAFMSGTLNHMFLRYDDAAESILGITSNQILDSGPCAKLYRLSILKDNGILFPSEIAVGEDLVFNLRFLRCVGEVRIIGVGVYRVNNNPKSVTHTINLVSSENDMLRLIAITKDELLESRRPQLIKSFALKQFFTLVLKSAKSTQKVGLCVRVVKDARNEFKLSKLRISEVGISSLLGTYSTVQLLVLLLFWKIPKLDYFGILILKSLEKRNKELRTYIL